MRLRVPAASRFCRQRVARIDRRSSGERATWWARTTIEDGERKMKYEREREREREREKEREKERKRERERERERKMREMREGRHGSASCLVNLFLFSPPGNRSYLRGLRVPPNFGFTRGVVRRKIRWPRYLQPRFRVRDRPNVYPPCSRLKHPWIVSVLRVDRSNLLLENTMKR